MGKGKNRKNNQGFSLIELIVVIAIIAILAGISTYSFNHVTLHRVKAFVNDCDALLSQCKIETMSGAEKPYFIITRDTDERMVTRFSKNNGGAVIEKVGSKSKKFKCEIELPGEPDPIEVVYFDLTFDHTTGRVKEMYYRTYPGQTKINASGCTKITISNAVGSKSIVLIPQTGYHEVQ